MSERESYRDWAQSVRSEARRNLMALRAERLARRQGGPVVEAPPPPAALPLPVSRQADSLVSDVPEEVEEVCEAPDESLAEMTLGAEVLPEAEPEASENPEEAETALDWTEERLRASPLAALPGAGTGLVWLLHVNGIDDLEALAAADAAELSQALGLVGRLVDVGAWIGFARQATAA